MYKRLREEDDIELHEQIKDSGSLNNVFEILESAGYEVSHSEKIPPPEPEINYEAKFFNLLTDIENLLNTNPANSLREDYRKGIINTLEKHLPEEA